MEETLNTIKRRYIHERAIYTWCGIALVAVNPYQEQDIYGEQAVETYHSASHSVYLQLDPHIYAVTEDAYSKLERNLKNQSIIVSGESGAGKTVSAKHAMNYLASIASSNKNVSSLKSKLRIEEKVLASNPIMEAIGNAKTIRNDNSSRFGKYIQIYFDRNSRKILGANMKTYLLEKSRVIIKAKTGERNFHIFYQLLNYAFKNPHKLDHLNLLDQNSKEMLEFNYLAGSKPSEKDSRDDLKKFNDSLKTLNINEERVEIIYRIVAGILHGGNIKFKPVDESNQIDGGCCIDKNDFHFKNCCQLIGLDPDEMERQLTNKLLKTGPREVINKPLNKESAEYARDAMLKYIYECLFTWLVGLINLSLNAEAAKLNTTAKEQQPNPLSKSPSSKKSSDNHNHHHHHHHHHNEPQFIGVLDIYGFENFKTNSFEQFCINYANEVLQQQYNQHVFKLEQEEYIREEIDWTFIEYCDNQPVIDVIESRPIGILNLLDEECRMPKGSDKSWCLKLFEHLADRKTNNKSLTNETGSVFKKPKMDYQSSFIIGHYAEEVTYNANSFLEKNRDKIAEEQSDLLLKSEVVSYIFEDPMLPANMRPKLKTNKTATVGHQFRGSLAALIKTLNETEPHYIRCIKPNDEKKAFKFNEERAVQQLKACGVYETIRISNNGFPSRWSYKDFAKRYCVLIYGLPIFEELAKESRERFSLERKQDSVESCENSDSLGEDREVSGSEEQLETVMTNQQALVKFMRHFSALDVRPICDAICRTTYEANSIYEHLRTKEEQAYIDQLIERHGNKSSAIYQFGKSKIFFRAGQVGYLERIRSQKLREYTITIQRFVRGWLARRSFQLKRELFLEQLRREASLVSLQNQVTSLQTELDIAKEEKKEIACENVSRMGSVYKLMVDMVYLQIQPLIIGAVLEFEALDPPSEPFSSAFESSTSSSSSNRSNSPDSDGQMKKQPMECLLRELTKFYDLIMKNFVPLDVATQAFKQLFYLICAQSLNQLLIRRDLCQFRKAMQISFNLSCLVQWCRERFLTNWREIVEQLDPITQATKLLQTRKSSEDIETINEVCNKLRPSQIIKILNMYTSSYEEQITTDFIHELEEYLSKSSAILDSNNNNSHHANGNITNNDLLMDTKKFYEFIDIE